MLVQARTNIGMSANLADYLLPICNAFGILGRIIPTLLADRYGQFNVTTIVMLSIAVVVLACWIPAHSNAIVVVSNRQLEYTNGFQCCTVNPRLLENTTLVKAQPDNTASIARASPTQRYGTAFRR